MGSSIVEYFALHIDVNFIQINIVLVELYRIINNSLFLKSVEIHFVTMGVFAWNETSNILNKITCFYALPKKLRKATRNSVCLSVCLSTWKNSVPT